MKPRAKKKARAMSHGIGSPKAEKAAANDSVLVRTEAPSPMRATAPSGSGCVMIPTIVARKMASNCHAFRETPDGTGTNQRTIPVAIDASNGFMAAPCHGCCCGAGVTVAADDAEAFTVSFLSLKEFADGNGGINFTNDSGVFKLRLLVFVNEFEVKETDRPDVDLGESLRERDLRE